MALATWLKERDVTQVDIVGIATDHCVRATALDARREGFETTVLLDLTAGVARATTDAALAQLCRGGRAPARRAHGPWMTPDASTPAMIRTHLPDEQYGASRT